MKTKTFILVTSVLFVVSLCLCVVYFQQKNKLRQASANCESEIQKLADKIKEEKAEIEKQLDLNANVYQKDLEFKNKLINKFKAQEEKERKEENIGEWKSYKNEVLGIEFKYPNEWTENEGKLNSSGVKGFKAYPLTDRGIQINILHGNESNDLKQIAQSILNENGGPQCGHGMESGDFGEMFMTTCGGGSEKYNYIFKNKEGVVIKIQYGDDFEDYWGEDIKVERLRKISSTIKTF